MHQLREQTPNKEDPARKEKPEEKPVDDAGRVKIRCPLCAWKHDWKAHWGCELCGAVFDTFRTRAHCPDPTCGNSWKLTWCPKCHRPSPHEDWYVHENSARD